MESQVVAVPCCTYVPTKRKSHNKNFFVTKVIPKVGGKQKQTDRTKTGKDSIAEVAKTS